MVGRFQREWGRRDFVLGNAVAILDNRMRFVITPVAGGLVMALGDDEKR
jgi:hypothetical protein